MIGPVTGKLIPGDNAHKLLHSHGILPADPDLFQPHTLILLFSSHFIYPQVTFNHFFTAEF